jgi:ABC-type lipoprotein export system ATPase subunit
MALLNSGQPGPGDTTEMVPLVRLRDVTRVYRLGSIDVPALRGVSLDVPAGQFLAVVGVSGSGKSTLLHLMGGLDTATSGRILVGEQELGALTERQRTLFRRLWVGMLFQAFYLVPHLTAAQNVRLALTLRGTYGSRRSDLADQALNRVGLEARRGHLPGQLSGGEQQRVAMARALVHRPRLLLADEPTGNLDRSTAHSLMGMLREINQESRTTVIVVTHDEDLLSRYCHRMLRIRDGRLDEAGPGG